MNFIVVDSASLCSRPAVRPDGRESRPVHPPAAVPGSIPGPERPGPPRRRADPAAARGTQAAGAAKGTGLRREGRLLPALKVRNKIYDSPPMYQNSTYSQ